MFEPSSADKDSPGKRISIWVEANTVADQAWVIMGQNPTNTIVACFKVDDVHAIVPPEGFQPLAAQWENAVNPANGSPDLRPGSEGHAGIWGLIEGGGKSITDAKLKRKQLRDSLASIARISPVPVPHDIPPTELTARASLLSSELGIADPEAIVMATRLIRRERVLAAELR